MITSERTVLKITASKPEEGFYACIKSERKISEICWKIKNASGEVECGGTKNADAYEYTIHSSFDAHMWSVEAPTLYELSLEIAYSDGTVETMTDKFGFRYFSCDEKNLYLNGYPFYMRAYIRGTIAHEHENNCNLSEYDFYKKNILTAKEYGFNTIRFHSVVPPEACLRAADDLGIMIHIEMRADNMEYDNLQEMLYGKNDFVTNEELEEIINSLYNHPSFMVYCVGNEIREPGKKPRIKEIRDFIKKNDPTRLFIDTCAHGEYDRDYVDFDVQHMGYFFPYGEHANMFADTDNLLCFGTVGNKLMIQESESGKIRRGIAFSRPLIAHEVCHYTSWRDYYALRDKFKKYNRPAPWWVDEEIKMLEAKGYKEDFASTLQITKDYQFRCWKTALEGIRTSPLLSGFHMLQFADTDRYENSNGVVDCFDDPHGISADEFRKFNADTVVIARLPKQVYSGTETVKVPVYISQYKINPPKLGTFSYTLSGKDVNSNGSLASVDTQKSGLYTLCSLELLLPDVKSAQKLELVCRVDFEDGTACENSWELWVFPKLNAKTESIATSGMDSAYLDREFSFAKDGDCIVTDRLDDELFENLEAGKNVMLIYRTDWTRHLLHKTMPVPKYSFRHTWDRYKGVIWDRGTINGGKDDKELLNKFGFVTDGQINFQYYSLIEDSDKINLDDFPVSVHSIVSGFDKASRDRFDATKFRLPELMYDRTMRHFSYAFELCVGKGKLLVTGFNFTGVEKGDVASVWMMKALLGYFTSSEFAPQNTISVNELKKYLSDVAAGGPQKEGMMTQYWQLDDAPVESMEYWEESERYLREK